jgi:hypothetical protein
LVRLEQLGQEFLLEQDDLFEGGKSMVECFKDRFDNSFSGVGEFRFVFIVEDNIDLEQGEFWFGSTKCLNLVCSIVDVVDLGGINY